MFNIGGNRSEKIREIDNTLSAITTSYIESRDIFGLLSDAADAKSFLDQLAVLINNDFPITTHQYTLTEQILSGGIKYKTDCRFVAILVAKIMERCGFENVALYYKPNGQKHISTLGSNGDSLFQVDFRNPSPKVYDVSDAGLDGIQYSIDGRGVLNFDSK